MATTTVLESLKGVNAYPIPLRTLSEVMERRGLQWSDSVTRELIESRPYKLAQADLFMWLSYAPSISQGGQSFVFTDEQRVLLRNRAKLLYDEWDEDEAGGGTVYGYKGDRL